MWENWLKCSEEIENRGNKYECLSWCTVKESKRGNEWQVNGALIFLVCSVQGDTHVFSNDSAKRNVSKE